MVEYNDMPSPFISPSPIMTMERLRNITAERLQQMRRMQEESAPAAEGLSSEQLRWVRTRWKATPQQRERFDLCAICLEGPILEARELISLPCQHVFCADCVCRWLARQSLCVLCKDDVRPKLPHR